MLDLNSKEWRDFFIKDIFITLKEKTIIQVPTGAYINKEDLQKGDTPRITVSSKNNGVDGYYDSSHKNYRIHKNFISVSFLGTVFYHPYKASIDMKVHCLQIIDKELNPYLAHFISTEIKKNLENASYGNQISSTDLAIKKLLLPVNNNGNPDWEFIEEYTKSIIISKQKKFINYLKIKKENLEYKAVESLEDKEWDEFFLIDIFQNIQRGKRLIKENQKKGNIPYVSSTSLNNGIDNFIGNETNVRIFSNCLSIANSGSVGASFYHPYKFVASDHITHLKNENMNKYIYLFISTLTNRFSEKYNFNREINDTRISREKIMLPIKDGKPDYEYMEQYMKNMTYKKLNQYLNFSKENH